MLEYAATARRMKEVLGLEAEPVAVYLLRPEDERGGNSFTRAPGHRYCQALMRARRGERILLTSQDLACPAAAAAFGFRPLPEGLANGKGLVGFGIVEDAAAGQAMFDSMPKLQAGRVISIAIAPLARADSVPDVVVVEGPPEPLMWLALADLNVAQGARRHGDTAVLQATCVDATIIPYLEHRLNYSLGCYGCREATDLGPGEAVIGFPGSRLEALVDALDHLAAKAIPRSRAKTALKNLQRKDAPHD